MSRAIRSRVTSYADFVAWLLHDSLGQFKRVAVYILATGALAVLVSGGALVLALRYAQLLESGDSVTVLGTDYAPRDSTRLLLLFALAVGGLLLLGAGLTYLSRRGALDLRIGYERLCSGRVLLALASTLDASRPGDQKLMDNRLVMVLARRDSRYCGRVLFSVIMAIVPCLTFVAMLAFMLYLQASLTLLLLAVIAVGLVFLYKVNVDAAHASAEVDRSAPAANREYREAINWIRGAAVIPAGRQWVRDSVLEAPRTQRFMTAYRNRLMASERARLVSNVLLAVCFLLILLRFGSEILREGTGFGRLIVYLIVLRTALTSFRVISQGITSVNRFYPQVRRYRAFLTADRSPVGGPPAQAAIDVSVDVAAELAPSASDISLRPGQRVGMLAPRGPDRYTTSVLLDCLYDAGARERHPSVWATGDYPLLHGRALRESFGLAADVELSDIAAQFADTPLQAEICGLADLLDAPVGSHPVPTSPAVRFALAWAAALASDAAIVVIDERGLRALPHRCQADVLDQLRGRLVVIVYHARATSPGDYAEDLVVVVDGTRTIGAGSVEWFAVNRTAAEELVREASLDAEPPIGPDAVSDEDDDEL